MARSSSGGASAKSGARKRHSAACVPSYPGRRLFGDRVAVGADAVLPPFPLFLNLPPAGNSRKQEETEFRAVAADCLARTPGY